MLLLFFLSFVKLSFSFDITKLYLFPAFDANFGVITHYFFAFILIRRVF